MPINALVSTPQRIQCHEQACIGWKISIFAVAGSAKISHVKQYLGLTSATADVSEAPEVNIEI